MHHQVYSETGTSGPQKVGGGLCMEVKSIEMALLEHNRVVFIEGWSLDTGGAGFTVHNRKLF